MPRRQTRITSSALQLAGVEPIPGPNVSDDIQLVYLLGDLSKLMPPLPFVHCCIVSGQAGVAAVFSGIELMAPPHAAVEVLALYNASATPSEWGLEQILDANINPEATDWTDPQGYVSLARLRRGTRVAAAQGFDVAATSYADAASLPILVSPGNTFCWTNDVANTVATMRMLYREVAVPAAVL